MPTTKPLPIIDYSLLDSSKDFLPRLKRPFVSWDSLTLAIWFKHTLGHSKYAETIYRMNIDSQNLIHFHKTDFSALGVRSKHITSIIAKMKNRIFQDAQKEALEKETTKGISPSTSSSSSTGTIFAKSTQKVRPYRFKFSLESECRVAKFPEIPDFDTLSLKVIEHFGRPLSLLYTDSDGDLIRIHNSTDILDAISESKASSIKLFVYDNSPKHTPPKNLTSSSISHENMPHIVLDETSPLDDSYFANPPTSGDFLSIPTSKPSKLGLTTSASILSLLTVNSTGLDPNLPSSQLIEAIIGSIPCQIPQPTTLWDKYQDLKFDFDYFAMDNIPDVFIAISEAGIIQYFNHAATDTLGYPSSSIFGKNISILMPEPFRSMHDSLLSRYNSNPGHPSSIIDRKRRFPFLHNDGRILPMTAEVKELQRVGKRAVYAAILTNHAKEVETIGRITSLENQKMALSLFRTPVALVNQLGIILELNSAAESIFGKENNLISDLLSPKSSFSTKIWLLVSLMTVDIQSLHNPPTILSFKTNSGLVENLNFDLKFSTFLFGHPLGHHSFLVFFNARTSISRNTKI